MKQRFYCVLSVLSFTYAAAQLPVDSIKAEEAKKILSFLTSDTIRGRGNYTKELKATADFIAERFSRAGLKTIGDSNSYFFPFGVKNRSKAIKDSNGKYNPQNILLNVVGALDGKSRPNEIIIFCAHYDHLGMVDNEMHFGANDNASGTTALLLLADYYSKRADNERTILFCAFAGEELGLHGSTDFVSQINPDAIVAVINIEMIGISSVGKNAFFITGANYSNFKKIFENNLLGKYKIRSEPSYAKELFKRSDNFPFAMKGIPAHTIMASDDDDECYHQPCDDLERINIENMTNLVRAIVIGSESLISGKDTPSRLKPDRLK